MLKERVVLQDREDDLQVLRFYYDKKKSKNLSKFSITFLSFTGSLNHYSRFESSINVQSFCVFAHLECRPFSAIRQPETERKNYFTRFRLFQIVQCLVVAGPFDLKTQTGDNYFSLKFA